MQGSGQRKRKNQIGRLSGLGGCTKTQMGRLGGSAARRLGGSAARRLGGSAARRLIIQRAPASLVNPRRGTRPEPSTPAPGACAAPNARPDIDSSERTSARPTVIASITIPSEPVAQGLAPQVPHATPCAFLSQRHPTRKKRTGPPSTSPAGAQRPALVSEEVRTPVTAPPCTSTRTLRHEAAPGTGAPSSASSLAAIGALAVRRRQGAR